MFLLSEQYRNIESTNGTRAQGVSRLSTCAVRGRFKPSKVTTGNGYCGVLIGGVWVFSCYFSPNSGIEAFDRDLGLLCNAVRGSGQGNVIVAGDFNAKATEWGSSNADARGYMILEVAVQLDIYPVNKGSEWTVRR